MKETLRKLIYRIFFHGGGFHLQRLRRRISGRRLTILTLHRVDDRATDDPLSLPTLFISIARFEGMLEFLQENYRFVSLEQVEAAIAGDGELPDNACHITFDDAYQDVFDHALPRLKKRGIPATIFVPTDFVAGRSPAFWWDEAYYLLRSAWERRTHGLSAVPAGLLIDGFVASWERLMECGSLNSASGQCVQCVHDLQSADAGRRRSMLDGLWRMPGLEREPFLAANGVADWETLRGAGADGFTVGSHTCSHCFLDCEPEEIIREELAASKREIERRLGCRVGVFAYPGGKVTDSTQELVRGAGYELGMTTVRGVNRVQGPPMLLKRVNIWNGSASGEGDACSRPRLAYHLR